MKPNRDWMKLGALVAVAAILVVGFTSIVDLPQTSSAQPVVAAPTFNTQPQQRPVQPLPGNPIDIFQKAGRRLDAGCVLHLFRLEKTL